MKWNDFVVHTQAGDVLLTKSRSAASAFAENGGCVIGVCPEKELAVTDFPEAVVLVAEEAAVPSSEEEAGQLSEAFIRRISCHFYGKPFVAAVTRRLVIRESTGDDYEAVYALLKLCEKGTPVTDDDAKSTPATGDNVKSMPVTDDNAGTGREESYRIFADGFDLTAIDSRETFLQYVNACYRFFGFGVWTVLLKEGIGQEEAVCLDADPDKVDPLGSALDKTVPLDGDPDKAEKVIGWCGLFPKKDKGEAGFHIELGYAIAPAFQRKGYGYEACCAILDYARKELELEPGQIVIRADGRNTAALRLAHKLGLEAEVV